MKKIDTIKNDGLIICIYVTSSILSFSLMFVYSNVYGFGVFEKDEQPFGKTYDRWVQEYWKWTAAIPGDPVTTYAGLKVDGCFVHEIENVVMLIDPAIGGNIVQKCEISSDQGILFPAWSAECDGSSPGNEKMSIKELSDCARGYNLGKVNVQVWIDNNEIAKLDVMDYDTNVNINMTEIYTSEFDITIPDDTHLLADKHGTFKAAVHGWFVFTKPLPPGEHTVHYTNDVRPTTLSGAQNNNKADITYYFVVK